MSRSTYLPRPSIEGVDTSPALRLTAAQRARAAEYRERLEQRLAEAMPSYFTTRMRDVVAPRGADGREPAALNRGRREGRLLANGDLR